MLNVNFEIGNYAILCKLIQFLFERQVLTKHSHLLLVGNILQDFGNLLLFKIMVYIMTLCTSE